MRNPDCAVRNEQLWIDAVEPGTGRPLRVKQISGAIGAASSAGSSRAIGRRAANASA